MSNNGLPTRGPRHMNGAAALFARAQDLSHVARAAAVARQAAPRVVNVGPDPEAYAKGAVALYQLLCVNDALGQLAKQCEQLPPDHMAREVAERIIQTLREVIAAAATLPEEPKGG